MKKELLYIFQKKKEEIRNKLETFKNLSENQIYNEFQFCLLTPQSNAQRCWQAVEQLSQLKKPTIQNVTEILSRKTRFHHTKAKRILKAKESFNKINPLLNNPNRFELRNQIAERVNGFGLKEASHFLRNIGHSNNQIAILDRHVLKNMHLNNIIEETKVKGGTKNYLEIEQKFLNFANSLKIQPDELDLFWWSQENGELFK